MTIAALILALFTNAPDARSGRDALLLDFSATWCGPCQQMRPAVDLLTRKGYPVQQVDIDRSPNLAGKYHVTSVPTFVVVDDEGRELARTSGLQPPEELARFYNEARAKLATTGLPTAAPARSRPPAEIEDRSDASTAGSFDFASETAVADEPAEVPASTMPRPWETVVRIKVHGAGIIGFGSGTIIYSDPENAIILTCAHIFKIEESRTQPRPDQFPRRITIDLFDGELHGPKRQQVHYVASLEGKAIDYDFTSDVGLILIKPGRKLPSARVVPPNWQARSKMEMITVGCSEGNDATAWTTTIVNPQSVLKVNGGRYDAIECVHAPKQGRSGGGLFTREGFVAGVCDFAEPQGNHGLYASPQSIYKMLDRNRLAALYQPSRQAPDTLLAQQGRPAAPRSSRPSATLRAQSPDSVETRPVTLPGPEMFNIPAPAVVDRSGPPRPESGGRPSWIASADPFAVEEAPVMTDLGIDPSVADDSLRVAPAPVPASTEAPIASRTRPVGGSTSGWQAVPTVPDRTASRSR